MILIGSSTSKRPLHNLPRDYVALPKRKLVSTPFTDGYLKGVYEIKQYGKTKAEREYKDRRGPKRYLFDGPNTMDKFYSEHPVQISQDTFREVMANAKNRAPLAFISEEKIKNSAGASTAHLKFVSRSKKPPPRKRAIRAKSQREMLRERLKEHEETWDHEFKDAFARHQARTVKPQAQKILDLKKKRAAILDKLLDNNDEIIDLQRRRREKKLRPRRNATDHAIFRRFQTANQSQIFKHDGGRRRRAQTVESKFRFQKTFNTAYADRLAREKLISKAHF